MSVETQRIDLGFVNAYLIKTASGYVLVDTGMAQHWQQLDAALHKAGCLPEKLELVILTHNDFDHTGNCARLQRQYGAKIAMHPADAEMVETGVYKLHRARTLLWKIILSLGTLLRGKNPFDTFQPDLFLEDGQDLRPYGLAAQVIHLPGHTPGSIAILTEDGQLFVGDTFTNQPRPSIAPLYQDMPALVTSIVRIKQAKARIVYPGHGNPFPFDAVASLNF